VRVRGMCVRERERMREILTFCQRVCIGFMNNSW